jgi:hypothetical protein
MVLEAGTEKVLEAFRVRDDGRRACSFAFSSRPVPSSWRAYTFDLPLAFYYVLAPGGTVTQIRSLALGIGRENFILLAVLSNQVVLVLRRAKRDDDAPFLVILRKEEDFERVASVVRRLDFVSDELTAHSSLFSLVDLLRTGAEKHFTNRGLFSTYFLKERLSESLSKRGRNVVKECVALLSKFGGEFPSLPEKAVNVLEALGYSVEDVSKRGFREYLLRYHGRILDVRCVVADTMSLDIKVGDRAAPSYQAVAALRSCSWVILTNGRFWRLYSNKVSSSSTNYFEIDMEGVFSETDERLKYFVSLFSASAFVARENITDVDLVFDESIRHARGVEDDLRRKVFDGGLFLNLVKGILDFSPAKRYSQEKLDRAKNLALKLLYRFLFILYAESRGLLPVNNAKYKEFSLEFLRPRLNAFEKEPDGRDVWNIVKTLFRMISKGDVDANLPQYDGALFEEDTELDGIAVKNKFLVPALRDLMESDGRGIDYQNLGVRHLGSLYEALLEYSVRQATRPLVMYREEILDAKYAEDLKQKPIGFIDEGELYLSVKGLARKGTGSYYTPEAIVNFLVKKGLEPHFKRREEQFKADLARLPPSTKPRDLELEKRCNEDLLGLKVLDPAMGSGHFLVAVVNEITQWVIDLLRQYPEAPLMREIDELRRSIIEEQRKRGIRLDEDLLTDDVILKRMVMKRCVYGVDINPLAVELAKVSLWLDSFTIGTPLTFLDHHIRCGDSLIGLWIKNISADTALDRWLDTFSDARTTLVEEVVMPPDLTVEQVAQSREMYEAARKKTEPMRILLDILCAGIIDPDLGVKHPNDLRVIEETCRKRVKPKWWADVEKALELAEKYRFFHFELEFPDAFTKEKRGFDLIVMNPPWDVIIPEDDDFFALYYPKIRRIRNKIEKKKIINSLLEQVEIKQAYEDYRRSVEYRNNFYLHSGLYAKRGREHANLWKLFMERAFQLTGGDCNTIAVVIPSSVVTDYGAKQIREELFKWRIRGMFEFENKYGVFPDVDRRFKFVLLIVEKTTPTDLFPAAFYLHKIEALKKETEQEKFVEIPVELVRISAPESLSIPEVRNKQQLEVFTWIYKTHPLLSDDSKGWKIALLQEELNRTRDSKLFRTDGKGWPLIEGKNFHQFIPYYEKPEYSVIPEEGLRRTEARRIYKGLNRRIHDVPRLAYRLIASSTNVRTMVACILPPKSFCPNSATLVFPLKNNKLDPDDKDYYRLITYLAGIFNSFVFDFLIRTRVSVSLNYFYVLATPVPHDFKGPIASRICEISAMLSAQDPSFHQLAEAIGIKIQTLDMHSIVELTSKLNALVAMHYGLNRQQLKIILESFDGFEEDEDLVKMKEIRWNDSLIRKFNGEVRKRVLSYFDELSSEQSEGIAI